MDRERGVSLSLDFGINYKVEKNATRRGFERELSLEVFAVSINKTRTVLRTDAHSSVLHTIGQR